LGQHIEHTRTKGDLFCINLAVFEKHFDIFIIIDHSWSAATSDIKKHLDR